MKSSLGGCLSGMGLMEELSESLCDSLAECPDSMLMAGGMELVGSSEQCLCDNDCVSCGRAFITAHLRTKDSLFHLQTICPVISGMVCSRISSVGTNNISRKSFHMRP